MLTLIMSTAATYRRARHFIATCLLGFFFAHASRSAFAQSLIESTKIDPQLEELVHIIKSRSQYSTKVSLRGPDILTQDDLYVGAIDKLFTALYSREAQTILDAVTEFDNIYSNEGSLALETIQPLFIDYAHGLKNELVSNDLQIAINEYVEIGNWFEKFVALEISAYHHSNTFERQAALQKAQLALGLIPENPEHDTFAKYAKIKITKTIAQLHNFQGNSALALEASLDYLRLTKDDPNVESEIDLINNLIYSYGFGRNHDAQLFLSQHLLQLEKVHTSSVPGLSEMRIANLMNAVSRFDEALDYALQAINKTEHPTVLRNSKIFEAVALAGLGRADEARKIATSVDVNLSPEHMLTVEESRAPLYLAFLLAQQDNPAYAVQLVNRQQDVLAQKLLSDNTRDTTATLAALENTRERQAEREAAAQREAALQALTIDRQRKLNRALIFLSLLFGAAALAAILFARYRSRMVSELEKKTEEAASAEKLKTDFLGMISHELRTPLNGIIGISDLLANHHKDPDIRKKTGIVLRSGNELLTVVESLTDMARLDAGQLVLVPHDADLASSLAAAPKAWTQKAQEKGLEFTSFIDPALSWHHVDADRLVQCLNILMCNAVSFTDRGRVHVHIKANHNDENEVDGLTAIVADTGQGMSELVQSRLFTPFMQADTSRKRTHMGTGLSLAIAYALVEMMGGKLTVSSREGRGSEFKFNIPLQAAVDTPVQPVLDVVEAPILTDVAPIKMSPPKIAPTKITPPKIVVPKAPTLQAVPTSFSDVPILDSANAPQREFVDLMTPLPSGRSLHEVETPNLQSVPSGKKRILVVDDLALNRQTLRYMLETEGHVCSEAADGFSALAKLDQSAFDLVILDVHMAPLDGVETLRRLRASGKPYAHIPVIALTADNAARTNADCMEAGADFFLTKPIQQVELSQAITYLHQAGPARLLSQ